jgi:hypothetical protein
MGFVFQFLGTITIILLLGLAIAKPMIALSLVITQFVLEQILQSYYSFFVTQNSAFNILVAIIAILSLTRLLTKAGTQIKIWNLATILTLFYFCFAATSTIWSPNTQAENLTTATLTYIIIYILIGPVLINNIIDLRNLFIYLLVIGTILAFLVLLNPNSEFLRGRFILKFAAVGSASDSNPLAMADLGGLLVVISGLLPPPTKNILWIIIRILAIGTGSVLLLDSGSRGQVLLSYFVVLVFYPISNLISNYKQFMVRAIGLIGLIGVVMLSTIYFASSGTEKRWQLDELQTASGGRLDNIILLLSEWIKTPSRWVWGLGNNSFNLLDTASNQPYVHNIIAESLGEFGIIGFLVLISLLLITIISGFKLYIKFKDFELYRGIIGTLLGVTFFIFLVSNKQGNVWVSIQLFMFFIIIVRTYRMSETEDVSDLTSYDEFD